MHEKVVFLEGIHDVKIFQKLLEQQGYSEEKQIGNNKNQKKLCKQNNKILLYKLNGWEAIKNNTFADEARQYSDQGYTCYLIIDADDTSVNEGGYLARKAAVDKIIKDHELNLNLFLLPDNKNDGDLETLIKATLLPNYKSIYDCCMKYIKCLQDTQLFQFNYNIKQGNKHFIHQEIVAKFPAQLETPEKANCITDLLDYAHSYFIDIIRFLDI